MTDSVEPHIQSRFELVKKIGSGAYGHVWKVIERSTRNTLALKKNFDAFNNSTDAQRTYRQIAFLRALSHPNIVKLERVIAAQNNKDIYLLFEHMDIDLYTLIREGILTEKHRKYIFYQTVKALLYLHSAGLIHRDVKPSNILVNQNCQAKLCDFGLVRSVDEAHHNQEVLTQYIATRWYRAPEILVGSRHYSKAIDIWSMGCMLAEMYKGKPLFAGTSTLNQLEKVLSWTGAPSEAEINSLNIPNAPTEVFKMLNKVKKMGKRELVPSASESCLDLISRMLQFDPSKRITIDKVILHPFLSEFYDKNEVLLSKEKIKINIDDNHRLSLRQYRNIIYEDINHQNNPKNQTIYRIKPTVRKSNDKKTAESSQQRLPSIENQYPSKKPATEDQYISKKLTIEDQYPSKKSSFQQKSEVLISKSRKLKTVEQEYDPYEAKKTVYSKQPLDRHIYTKYDGSWGRRKRSATEGSTKKKAVRIVGVSPAQLKYKLF